MFDKLVLFGTILVSSCSGINSPKWDYSQFFIHTDPASRIVGGSLAPEGSAPYMVALTDGILIRSYFCGGSLVSTRSVLTAAHCIDHVFGKFFGLSMSLRGTLGTYQHIIGGIKYRFARNVTHPYYHSGIIKNDIGLLITFTDVVLSSTVSVVPLSFNLIGAGVQARVTGWGRIGANAVASTLLLELHVNTIEGQQCVEEVTAAAETLGVTSPPVDPHIEICTFHSAGLGTCNGDSGSPLVEVSSGRQIGVVSWGFPCARGSPDMFVRISAYSDWLNQNLV